MYVVKRDGRKEPVHFDKITARITKLSYGLNPEFCDPVSFSCHTNYRHHIAKDSKLLLGYTGESKASFLSAPAEQKPAALRRQDGAQDSLQD